MSGATALFRTEVQRDVLRDLVLSADNTRTAADLARSTGHPPSSVAREVARLVDAGLVRTTPRGRRHLLSADYADPFMAAVRDAFAAEATIEAERDRGVRWWSTMPEVAERVRDALADDDSVWANRMLCDAVNQIPLVAALDGLDVMLAAPEPIGDDRWDALLAGAVRYRLRLIDRSAPSWTERDPLPAWWWPGGRGARAVLAMQRTPPELSRLGIWFDARNFTGA
ncbi:winged helix-turn-helix domain-containing protein [Cellulomonas xiejunii]|uniref:Winged helix-turn-helix domain-containing protein n=1 Tax=Cellulomonas xiejunii TaxID=2968083 RepID=A0ABY5KRY8_9CELL|nr:winged helix-turn-helix domain-containing protein [Cellulomonas xiejunii]MCC2322166.1 winged helix-turn-helix domain-containing protein [Cellulomonas xiejunii]MCC2323191.1 winged helix-turn-helix domain-containing protein [Cellulomonas xiejunii]UUI72221.1 winged helix-turn-helix domain-containing protein [Cellulomonas xiejunii]